MKLGTCVDVCGAFFEKRREGREGREGSGVEWSGLGWSGVEGREVDRWKYIYRIHENENERTGGGFMYTISCTPLVYMIAES